MSNKKKKMNEKKFLEDFKELIQESNSALLFDIAKLVEEEIMERTVLAETEKRTEDDGDWS